MVGPFSPSTNNSHVKIDLTQLNLLSRSDPAFKNQILSMLQAQAEEVVHELSVRSKESNWDAVADTAHRFKSAVNIVNQQAYSHFKELEKEAREPKDIPHLTHLIDRGITICTYLARNISQLLAEE